MTGLTLALLLQTVVVSAGEKDYASAYKEMEETGRPLVVLIGADWSPACQSLKHGTIANMKSAGEFSEVSFTTINTDQDPTLANKLMKGGSIPQLVVYTQSNKGWRRMQLTGNQSRGSVRDLLRRAVDLRKTATTTKSPTTTK